MYLNLYSLFVLISPSLIANPSHVDHILYSDQKKSVQMFVHDLTNKNFHSSR